MLSLILLFLALVYYYYFYKRTKDLLNPIGVMLFIWCITASISALYLAPLQEKWNFEMVFVVVSSSITVFFAGYLVLPKNKRAKVVDNINITNAFIIVTRIIFFICLVCVLIEWRYNDYLLPGLYLNETGVDLKSRIESISVIHYGSILMPFCAIFAFFEFKYTKATNKVFLILVMIISIVFYSFLFSLSRGTLLSVFLGIIFLQHKKKPISIKGLVAFIMIVLVVFVGIAVVRLPEGSLVFTSLGDSSSFYKYISPIYTYIGYSFENLNKLILSDSQYTLFNYSLKFIWDLMGFRNDLDITLYDTLFFNARTYLYPFYHDMGIWGILVFPFIIGIIISAIYKKSNTKPGYILLLAVLQRAIINVFFGNYFFGEFIILWPYIVTWLVVVFLNYRITKEKTGEIRNEKYYNFLSDN